MAIFAPPPARAHVDAATGQDYQGYQRNDGGGSCCDWHDCRPASEPFVEPDGEKIIDRGQNKYAFDRGKIVSRPSDDGNWHICGDATRLKCIIAPAEARFGPRGKEVLSMNIASFQPAAAGADPGRRSVAPLCLPLPP